MFGGCCCEDGNLELFVRIRLDGSAEPGKTKRAPTSGAEKTMPQEFAWNMGTMGSTTLLLVRFIASGRATTKACSRADQHQWPAVAWYDGSRHDFTLSLQQFQRKYADDIPAGSLTCASKGRPVHT